MKLGKMIGPIGIHLPHKTKNKIVVKVEEDVQTEDLDDQSIAIPNQLPHHDHSYFTITHIQQTTTKQPENQIKQSSTLPSQNNVNKKQLLEDQLMRIEEMKSKYYRQQLVKNNKNDSINMSERCGKQKSSAEKHGLRPSAAPKMYTQTSQFTIETLKQIGKTDKISQEEGFSFKMEHPEVIYYDHDSLFEQSSKHEDLAQSVREQNNSERKGEMTRCECQKNGGKIAQLVQQKFSVLKEKINHIQLVHQEKRQKEERQRLQIQTKFGQICKIDQQRTIAHLQPPYLPQKYQLFNQDENLLSLSFKKPAQNSNSTKKTSTTTPPKVSALLQRLQLRIQTS